MTKESCPDKANHTEEPKGYLDWHSWAKKKMKTHKQIKCKSCGLYVIWVPKRCNV